MVIIMVQTRGGVIHKSRKSRRCYYRLRSMQLCTNKQGTIPCEDVIFITDGGDIGVAGSFFRNERCRSKMCPTTVVLSLDWYCTAMHTLYESDGFPIRGREEPADYL